MRDSVSQAKSPSSPDLWKHNYGLVCARASDKLYQEKSFKHTERVSVPQTGTGII